MADQEQDIPRGHRFRGARLAARLSQSEMGRLIGVEKQTISKWETGWSTPSKKTLRRVAQVLNQSTDFLLHGDHAATVPSNVVDRAREVRAVAKLGTTETGPIKSSRAAELVPVHFPCSDAAYALTVVGVSMEPDFNDGDIVIIDPNVKPQPGNFVEVEMTKSKRHMLRKYRPVEMGDDGVVTFELVASNRDWPVERVGPTNKGKVLGTVIQRISHMI